MYYSRYYKNIVINNLTIKINKPLSPLHWKLMLILAGPLCLMQEG